MQNTSGGPEHPGSTRLLVTMVVVLLVIGGVAWWLASRTAPPPSQQPGGQEQRDQVTLPPLPEKIYDVSGTVTAVGNGSFTLTAKIRTDKDTVAEGFREAQLTVRYDGATKFEERAAYAGDGRVPASSAATAGDLEVGQLVDVRSRENIRNVDSFIAGSVTIKPAPNQ